MIKFVNNVYSLFRPTVSALELPIVLDSPHSGMVYPTNTGIVAPANALRSTWDAYVDELWSAAPVVGITLLAARFPRAYIDVDRNSDDIDPELLQAPWSVPLSPSDECMRGMGLIPRYALPRVPMYAEPLQISEVMQRLKQYYQPYHEALKNLIDDAHARYGHVWHLNCHSMKSIGNAMNIDMGNERPDIVVSDCNGMSASARFAEWTAMQFDQMGYHVRINDPYQGGYIVQHYGVPTHGRQSIRIEIKRSLYMNEMTFKKTAGFEPLQKDLETFLSNLKQYVARETAISTEGCATVS